MKVIATITSGNLVKGEQVEGTSIGYTKSGRVAFTATWAGTFDGEEIDRHDGEEMYLYFTDGHINGIAQPNHGFPSAQLVR